MMPTRKTWDMRSTYSRGEDTVGQRQTLQVGHEAVGQEGVDGSDLRRGSRFNWEERDAETFSRDVTKSRSDCIHLFVILSPVRLIDLISSSLITRRVAMETSQVLLLWFLEIFVSLFTDFASLMWACLSEEKLNTGMKKTHSRRGRVETSLSSPSCSLSWQAWREV